MNNYSLEIKLSFHIKSANVPMVEQRVSILNVSFHATEFT